MDSSGLNFRAACRKCSQLAAQRPDFHAQNMNPHQNLPTDQPNSLRPWLFELYDKYFSGLKLGCGWRDETDLDSGMKMPDAPLREVLFIKVLRNPEADIYRDSNWDDLVQINTTYDVHGVPVSVHYLQIGFPDSVRLWRAITEFREEIGQAIGTNLDTFAFDHAFDHHQLVDLIDRGILRKPPVYDFPTGTT